jgi:signal transduction histidine kinase
VADRLRDGSRARLDLLRCSASTHAGPQFAAELKRVVGDLDRLARGLAPSALDEGGSLRQAIDRMAALAGLPVYCELDDRIDALPPPTAALVYFIAAECLTNVVRHANASSARVTVRSGSPVVVEVVDDGRGGAVTGSGRGLRGLADRLAMVSGSLRVDSPSGGPTRVRAEIPSAQAERDGSPARRCRAIRVRRCFGSPGRL